MHIYLIRHGQSIENTTNWDGKNTNSPLTELGMAQAKALALFMQARPERFTLDAVYASPMQRASQTAHCIADTLGLEVIYDDRLREVGNAFPDGRPFPNDKLPLYHLGVWGSLHPYQPITANGENWMHFRARVGGFLEWLIHDLPSDHKDRRVAVVCHGGVIEGFFEHIFQKGPWSAVVVGTSNTGLTHLEYRPTEGMPSWWVNFHNSTRHLGEDQLS